MSLSLFSRKYGDGDSALIILHGLLGSSTNWQSLAKRFAQKRTVYTLDLRNHGQSPWSDETGYQAMAEDVRAFISTLNHSNITLLGHSMGGKVAMMLALKHPDNLKNLIIADIAPVTYQHNYDHLIKPMLSLDLGKLNKRGEADEQLSRSIADKAIRSFLLHNLAFDALSKHWAWRPNLAVLLENTNTLTEFDLPQAAVFKQTTLFISGEQSDYVKPKDQPLIQTLFPQTSFAQIKNAGHWLHAEQPKQFLETCERFLSLTH